MIRTSAAVTTARLHLAGRRSRSLPAASSRPSRAAQSHDRPGGHADDQEDRPPVGGDGEPEEHEHAGTEDNGCADPERLTDVRCNHRPPPSRGSVAPGAGVNQPKPLVEAVRRGPVAGWPPLASEGAAEAAAWCSVCWTSFGSWTSLVSPRMAVVTDT